MTQAASQSITGLESLAAGIQFAPQLLLCTVEAAAAAAFLNEQQPRTELV